MDEFDGNTTGWVHARAAKRTPGVLKSGRVNRVPRAIEPGKPQTAALVSRGQREKKQGVSATPCQPNQQKVEDLPQPLASLLRLLRLRLL
ncbi:MAG TPA: hypothetical protein VF748_12015 [Candidatus Acidoferrum sp.]